MKSMTKSDLRRWESNSRQGAAFAQTFAGTAEPGWYASPINLPERSSGKVKITHRIEPAGAKLDVVSMREALMKEQRPASVILKERTIIHQLVEEGPGLWMTDLPCELNQAQVAIKLINPVGRVLVGGLGLGILPAYLSQMPQEDVEGITVVEKNKDVIKLCADHDRYDVEHGTIERFLATTKESFDAIFLDTWQGQSESTFWLEVFPLRRLVRRRFGPIPLWCWKDDEFMSQAYGSLRRPSGTHWFHKKLELPLPHKEAVFFLTKAGFPEWEKRYSKVVRDK